MFHKSRVFLYFLLAFILGVLIGSFFVISKALIFLVITLGLGALCIFWQNFAWRRLVYIIASVSVILVGLGMWRVASVTQNNSLTIVDGTITPIIGYIDSEPVLNGTRQQFVLRANQRLLVTTEAFPRYKYGDELEVIGKILRPHNFEDSDFDYVAYLGKDDIFYVIRYPEIKFTKIDLSPLMILKRELYKGIFSIKRSFEASIERSVAEPNASFINGILLGTRSQIPDDLKRDFETTGTTHILAISGYNITIVAGMISSFLTLFIMRKKAFWLAIIGIAFFAILTGASASVVRAALMGVLVLLARHQGRMSHPTNALFFAAAVMIWFNPKILRFDVGFQLSFAATAGLLYVVPVIEKYFRRVPKFFQLRETLVMTLAAQITVLPLLIYHFKALSLVSFPANILVLPVVPYTMLMGFITGVAGIFLDMFGQIFGVLAWVLSTYELSVIKAAARIPLASLSLSINGYMVIVFYILFYLGLRKIQKKHDKYISGK